MHVDIVYSGWQYSRVVREAVDVVNACQSAFTITLREQGLLVLDLADSPVQWEKLKKTLDNSTANYTVYIIDEPFEDNWFSHEETAFSVVTTADWNEHFAPPSLRAYLLYQIAQSILCFLAGINEHMEMHMVHDKAVGCAFDFCGLKTEIEIGMRSGAICADCRTELRRYGVSDRDLRSVEAILERVRAETFGRDSLYVGGVDAPDVNIRSPKLFISHSSIDKEYVDAFVDLLASVGVGEESIFCSSVPGYNVPLGTNILDEIARQLREYESRVVFMLSKNFYDSVVCLNEMGAAWILEREYTVMLIPPLSFSDVKGVVDSGDIFIDLGANNEELCTRLNELKETILSELKIEVPGQNVWEHHRNNFVKRVKSLDGFEG